MRCNTDGASKTQARIDGHIAAINARISTKGAANVERVQNLPEQGTLSEFVLQLPLWADALRGLPNEIVRSALFNARNRNLPRSYFEEAEIAVIGGGRITYTGKELRQDDETVWLQLIHLARNKPLGQAIEFTPYSFCKSIGWTIEGRSYLRLRACLIRMKATSLSVYSGRISAGVALSLIREFSWKDVETGRASRLYKVEVHPSLVQLFQGDHFTRFEWSQRLSLPDGIATWLHCYLASHRDPYPIKFETIKSGAGITTRRMTRVRELIEKALRELVKVGFLIDWKIAGELVHVRRSRR
jgi:TrfA protein